MFQEIDCRGLSCPQPVINTKKLLDSISEGIVKAIVDNEAAKENLLKLAKGLNLSAEAEQHHDAYHVIINKSAGATMGYAETVQRVKGSYALLITQNVLGKGNDELGAVLVKSLFYTLTEQEGVPMVIAFLNSGVFLTCEKSAVLEHIMNLEKRGAEIMSCGTCLDFYDLKEKLCVGTVSNMYTILEKIQMADKVITI